MPEERIFRDEESLTPDALAADRHAAGERNQVKLPPFVFAVTSVTSRYYNGIT